MRYETQCRYRASLRRTKCKGGLGKEESAWVWRVQGCATARHSCICMHGSVLQIGSSARSCLVLLAVRPRTAAYWSAGRGTSSSVLTSASLTSSAASACRGGAGYADARASALSLARSSAMLAQLSGAGSTPHHRCWGYAASPPPSAPAAPPTCSLSSAAQRDVSRSSSAAACWPAASSAQKASPRDRHNRRACGRESQRQRQCRTGSVEVRTVRWVACSWQTCPLLSVLLFRMHAHNSRTIYGLRCPSPQR